MKNPKITLTKDGLKLVDAPERPTQDDMAVLSEGGDIDFDLEKLRLYEQALQKAVDEGIELRMECTPQVWYSIEQGKLYDIPEGYTVKVVEDMQSEYGGDYVAILDPVVSGDDNPVPENIGFQGKHVHHSQQSRPESTPVIEQKEERNPTPLWQICPKCQGAGKAMNFSNLLPTTHDVCDVCNGTKIISIVTGLPPKSNSNDR